MSCKDSAVFSNGQVVPTCPILYLELEDSTSTKIENRFWENMFKFVQGVLKTKFYFHSFSIVINGLVR